MKWLEEPDSTTKEEGSDSPTAPSPPTVHEEPENGQATTSSPTSSTESSSSQEIAPTGLYYIAPIQKSADEGQVAPLILKHRSLLYQRKQLRAALASLPDPVASLKSDTGSDQSNYSSLHIIDTENLKTELISSIPENMSDPSTSTGPAPTPSGRQQAAPPSEPSGPTQPEAPSAGAPAQPRQPTPAQVDRADRRRMRRTPQPHTKMFSPPSESERKRNRAIHTRHEAGKKETPTTITTSQLIESRRKASTFVRQKFPELEKSATNPYPKRVPAGTAAETRALWRRRGFPADGPPRPTPEDLAARGEKCIITILGDLEIDPHLLIDCRAQYFLQNPVWEPALPPNYRPLYQPVWMDGDHYICHICVHGDCIKHQRFDNLTQLLHHHANFHVPVGKFICCCLFGCSYKLPYYQYRDMMKHALSKHPDHYGLMYNGERFITLSAKRKKAIFSEYLAHPFMWIIVICLNDNFRFETVLYNKEHEILWTFPAPSTDPRQVVIPHHFMSDEIARRRMWWYRMELNSLEPNVNLYEPTVNKNLFMFMYVRGTLPKGWTIREGAVPKYAQPKFNAPGPAAIANSIAELDHSMPEELAGRPCPHVLLGDRQGDILLQPGGPSSIVLTADDLARLVSSAPGHYRPPTPPRVSTRAIDAARASRKRALEPLSPESAGTPSKKARHGEPSLIEQLQTHSLGAPLDERDVDRRDPSAAWLQGMLFASDLEVREFLETNEAAGNTRLCDPRVALGIARDLLAEPTPTSYVARGAQCGNLRLNAVCAWSAYRQFFEQCMRGQVCLPSAGASEVRPATTILSAPQPSTSAIPQPPPAVVPDPTAALQARIDELEESNRVLLQERDDARQRAADHQATANTISTEWMAMPTSSTTEAALRASWVRATNHASALERHVERISLLVPAAAREAMTPKPEMDKE